jgi:hypothetical protein
MVNKKIRLGMMVTWGLVLGMAVIGCDNGSTGGSAKTLIITNTSGETYIDAREPDETF